MNGRLKPSPTSSLVAGALPPVAGSGYGMTCPPKVRLGKVPSLRTVFQLSTINYKLSTNPYGSIIKGYLKSFGGTRFSLMDRGDVQRIMLWKPPALSLVPEALPPPNGC